MTRIVFARLELQSGASDSEQRSLEQLCKDLSVRIVLSRHDGQHVFWVLESGETMAARLHAALALAGAEILAEPAAVVRRAPVWTIAIVESETNIKGDEQ